MRHQLLFGVLPLVVGLLLVVGCEAPSPAPLRSVPVVEVTGEPEFFCRLSTYPDFFNKSVADYASGNRRAAAALSVLDSAAPANPGLQEERLCWQSAIFYLAVFAPRAVLPRLAQLATHDPILEAETTKAEDLTGLSDLGESRSSAHTLVYFALAAQVRRQLMFDGRLDAEGERALRLVEVCAGDEAFCMPATPMHRSRRERLQRNAVKALGVTGAPSSARVLAAIASAPPSDDDYLMPYAYCATLDIKAVLDACQLWLLWLVPRP